MIKKQPMCGSWLRWKPYTRLEGKGRYQFLCTGMEMVPVHPLLGPPYYADLPHIEF